MEIFALVLTGTLSCWSLQSPANEGRVSQEFLDQACLAEMHPVSDANALEVRGLPECCWPRVRQLYPIQTPLTRFVYPWPPGPVYGE